MMKKTLILALMGLTLASQSVLAASEFDTPATKNQAVENTIKPYMAIGNFKEDRKRVFMFFGFNCPYCSQTWVGMEQWGKTLPTEYKFVAVPVITNQQASQVAAMAYYVVRDLAPHRMDEFKRQAYALGNSGKEGNGEGYVKILLNMGFTMEQIKASGDKEITMQRMERAVVLGNRYNVRLTPTFGVGGKYATHAGYTNGKYEVLVQLLNGLVSKIIEDGN